LAEEPLRFDLDVKGLNKPQVFGRLKFLDAREDLLSEFVPAMEARGYDTGDEGGDKRVGRGHYARGVHVYFWFSTSCASTRNTMFVAARWRAYPAK
jgi:hypothetical protein